MTMYSAVMKPLLAALGSMVRPSCCSAVAANITTPSGTPSFM